MMKFVGGSLINENNDYGSFASNSMTFNWYDGGSVLVPGVRNSFTLPASVTFTGWEVFGDQYGSLEFDIWEGPVNWNTSVPTDVDDSIIDSTTVQQGITSGTYGANGTSGWWSTTVTTSSLLRVVLLSCTNITNCVLTLKFIM